MVGLEHGEWVRLPHGQCAYLSRVPCAPIVNYPGTVPDVACRCGWEPSPGDSSLRTHLTGGAS
jgi:hypothetical protein